MSSYEAKDIEILDDLSHVRKRPEMYIHDRRRAGLHQLIKEVVDNALDEHLAGHATEVKVSVDTNTGAITVEDNGRGIPVADHPQTGISTLTSIFTKLHSGGKFGQQAYIWSSGLHGVGATVVNALSELLEVWVERDSGLWYQKFSRGDPQGPIQKLKKISKYNTSTKVRFIPDSTVFVNVRPNAKTIQRWLHETSALCDNLKITVFIDDQDPIVYENKDGIKMLLDTHCKQNNVETLHDPIILSLAPDPAVGRTSGIEMALAWTNGEGEVWYNYCNLTPVPEGGTQCTGVRRTVTKALGAKAAKGTVLGDDLREGLVVALHVKVSEPNFKGQTKTKLQNPELDPEIHAATMPIVEKFVQANGKIVDEILKRAAKIQQARAQFKKQKAALRNVILPGRSKRGVLPGKLAEASHGVKPEDRELFIVEGQSAAGTAKKARDNYQEVLPLRGKIVNAARVDVARLLKNQEILDIISAIGAGIDQGGNGGCEPARARVGKIFLLMDADPDGQHISSLMLTFIFMYMKPLIKAGAIYVVDSPLFVAAYQNKRYFGHTKQEIVQQLPASAKAYQLSRLKGHGEADPHELKTYAMDPTTRNLFKVVLGDDDDKMVLAYMGHETSARKTLLGIT